MGQGAGADVPISPLQHMGAAAAAAVQGSALAQVPATPATNRTAAQPLVNSPYEPRALNLFGTPVRAISEQSVIAGANRNSQYRNDRNPLFASKLNNGFTSVPTSVGGGFRRVIPAATQQFIADEKRGSHAMKHGLISDAATAAAAEQQVELRCLTCRAYNTYTLCELAVGEGNGNTSLACLCCHLEIHYVRNPVKGAEPLYVSIKKMPVGQVLPLGQQLNSPATLAPTASPTVGAADLPIYTSYSVPPFVSPVVQEPQVMNTNQQQQQAAIAAEHLQHLQARVEAAQLQLRKHQRARSVMHVAHSQSLGTEMEADLLSSLHDADQLVGHSTRAVHSAVTVQQQEQHGVAESQHFIAVNGGYGSGDSENNPSGNLVETLGPMVDQEDHQTLVVMGGQAVDLEVAQLEGQVEDQVVDQVVGQETQKAVQACLLQMVSMVGWRCKGSLLIKHIGAMEANSASNVANS